MVSSSSSVAMALLAYNNQRYEKCLIIASKEWKISEVKIFFGRRARDSVALFVREV